MATVIFYEKPGCANNRRQKRILEELGHQVDARDLLSEPWTADRLKGFFGDRPVADWINKAAPAVTSGALDPAGLTASAAMAAMLADPLLIRRPLIEVEGGRTVGFDLAEIRSWLDVAAPARPLGPRVLAAQARVQAGADLETCRRPARPCSSPGEALPDRPVTEADITEMVRRFYDYARDDARLGPMFVAAIPDWDGHLAIVADFWSHSLLGTRRYQGHPYPVHIHLPIEPDDFDLWLHHFTRAVTEVLPATAARQALARAHHMSGSFKAGLFAVRPKAGAVSGGDGEGGR